METRQRSDTQHNGVSPAGAGSRWLRLLWKEFRESWAVLAIGALLPQVATLFTRYEDCAYVCSGLTGVLLVLWAIQRTYNWRTADTRMALPMPALPRWVVIYLVPLIVPVALGVSVALMFNAFRVNNDYYVNLAPPLRVMLPTLVSFMVALFCLATALSRIYSPMLAALVCLPLFVGGFSVENTLAGNGMLYARIAISALVAALLWGLFARRQWYLVGRVALALMMAVIVVYPQLLKGHARPPMPSKSNASYGAPINELMSANQAVHIWVDMSNEAKGKHIFAFDKRTGAEVSRTFKNRVSPLAIGDQHVLIGESIRKHVLRIWNWDLKTNAITEISQMPTGRNFPGSEAAIRPDGKYAVLVMEARYGLGKDVWVFDLVKCKAFVALPNREIFPEWANMTVSWLGDRAIVSGLYGLTMEIDLRTMRAKVLDFANKRRAAR